MKRILSLILVLAMCLGMFTGIASAASNPFTDVKEGKFYYDAVLWAVEMGVTTGTSATTFEPSKDCTRGQVVTFLWRAAGSPEPSSTENPFTDTKETAFYYKAMLWAVEKGITNGTSATTFEPNTACNRGQVATFLWRTLGSEKAENQDHPFTDIQSGKFYYDAVLWAVEKEITNGTTATTFAPGTICNRGTIVTFLYRALKEGMPEEELPEETDPTEPQLTEPQPTEPEPTETMPTEPQPTEPKPTEPQPTEPKPTEPDSNPDPLKITRQPEANSYVYDGNSVTLTVKISGGTAPYTFMWFSKKDSDITSNAEFKDYITVTSSGSTSTLRLKMFAAYPDAGMAFQCLITDGKGQTITTNATKVFRVQPMLIKTQPKTYVLEGDVPRAYWMSYFNVEITGGTQPHFYCWEYNKNGVWTSFDETNSYEDTASTAALVAMFTPEELNFNEEKNQYGQQVRCVITDGTGKRIYSETAMTYFAPLEMDKQPASLTQEAGKAEYTFTASAKGGYIAWENEASDYHYQWQVYTNGSWSNCDDNANLSGSDSSTITVAAANAIGSRYRCIITDDNSNQVISKECSVAANQN